MPSAASLPAPGRRSLGVEILGQQRIDRIGQLLVRVQHAAHRHQRLAFGLAQVFQLDRPDASTAPAAPAANRRPACPSARPSPCRNSRRASGSRTGLIWPSCSSAQPAPVEAAAGVIGKIRMIDCLLMWVRSASPRAGERNQCGTRVCKAGVIGILTRESPRLRRLQRVPNHAWAVQPAAARSGPAMRNGGRVRSRCERVGGPAPRRGPEGPGSAPHPETREGSPACSRLALLRASLARPTHLSALASLLGRSRLRSFLVAMAARPPAAGREAHKPACNQDHDANGWNVHQCSSNEMVNQASSPFTRRARRRSA